MGLELHTPAIGILRGIDKAFFSDLMQVSFTAGLQAIEVTMNTKGAADIISSCLKDVPDGKLLGAGTVRNIDEAKLAADAGAMFFVTPNLDVQVIEFALKNTIPVICGALTPTEVYTAWSAGADMIKIFPCAPFGPDYIRDLKGPFDQIPLVAVGGVTLSNLELFFQAGTKAVGVSTSLFGKSALASKDLKSIAKNVAAFVAECNRCRTL